MALDLQPSKYPRTGTNYARWGEQPGLVYDPFLDKYRADPKQSKDYYEKTGLQEKEPEKPGLMGLLGPIAGVGAVSSFASALGKDPTGTAKNIYSGITGLVDNVGSGLSEISGLAENSSALSDGIAGAASGASELAPYGTIADEAGNAIGTAGAPVAEAPGMLSYAGPALGIAAGSYGMYDLLANRESSDIKAGLQGVSSGAALGAGVGSIVPGVGTVIGGAVGAGVGGLIGLASSMFGGGDKWKTERKALQSLKDDGVFIPDGLIGQTANHGRSKEELIRKDLPADFIGRDPNGEWVNNKFAESRSESDLRAEDIVNYADFAKHDPNWFKEPLEERLKIADSLLKSGAVDEHHGSITIDWDKSQPPPPTTPPPNPGPMPMARTNIPPGQKPGMLGLK